MSIVDGMLFGGENSFLLSSKSPICKMGSMPEWFHHHGEKIRLLNKNENLIELGSNAAYISIAKHPLKKECFFVSWKVLFFADEGASGKVSMDVNQILGAFSIKNFVDDPSRWLISRYGGDSACQGKFLKWLDYLNIPGPGTGNDGDPNISLALDQDIKEAVRNLVFSD